MHSSLRAIVPLLAGAVLLTAGNALLGTLVSLRMATEDFPQVFSGLVMSAYFAGFMLGASRGSRIIDRVGHIRAFAAFAALFGAAAAAHGLLVSPLPWIVLRGVVGFAMAGELMVIESWLNISATGARRAQVFSVYMMAIYLAFGGGQFALVLGDPAGASLFLVVTLFLCASILPIVLTPADAPSIPPTRRLPVRVIYDAAPLGLLGSMVAGIAVGAVQSIGPQFANQVGLTVSGISLFMGAFFLSGVLLQWPAGYLSDHMDRRRVIVGMAALSSVAFVAIALLADRSFVVLIGLAIVGGGAVATLYPLSVAHANDRLPDHSVVAIAERLLLAYGLGAIAGPTLATTVMTVMGAGGLFYTTAVPCIALTAYAALRIFRYQPVEQGAFESVAQTTPVMLELDPRAPDSSSVPHSEPGPAPSQ